MSVEKAKEKERQKRKLPQKEEGQEGEGKKGKKKPEKKLQFQYSKEDIERLRQQVKVEKIGNNEMRITSAKGVRINKIGVGGK